MKSDMEHQDASDSDSLLSHSRDDIEFRPRDRRRRWLIAISLLASHILIALAGGWTALRFVDRDSLCAKYTAHYCKIYSKLCLRMVI
jgi:hypothetical protein